MQSKCHIYQQYPETTPASLDLSSSETDWYNMDECPVVKRAHISDCVLQANEEKDCPDCS